MFPNRLLFGAVAALCLILVAAMAYVWSESMRQARSFALLSDEQVIAYQTTPVQQVRSLALDQADGPQIRVSAPEGFALTSPVDFDIQVEPRDGVAVDMTSIRIDYRLGPAWVNVTGKILKHASVTGSRLYASGADLPKGKHALRISIKDAQQRTTRATVSFSVAK